MESQTSEAAKKTYDTPRLLVYGDIRAITQANDNAGMNDGKGGGINDKT